MEEYKWLNLSDLDVSFDGESMKLLLPEESKVRCKVYEGELQLSPIRSVKCFSYRAEISLITENGKFTLLSLLNFGNFTLLLSGGYLLAVDGVILNNFKPNYCEVLSYSALPEGVKRKIPKAFQEENAKFECYEWCIESGKEYLLTVNMAIDEDYIECSYIFCFEED